MIVTMLEAKILELNNELARYQAALASLTANQPTPQVTLTENKLDFYRRLFQRDTKELNLDERDDRTQCIVDALNDGAKTQREVAKLLGISIATVNYYSQRGRKNGLSAKRNLWLQ